MPEWILPSRVTLVSGAMAGLIAAGSLSRYARPKRHAPDGRMVESIQALTTDDLDRAFQPGTAYLKQPPDDPRRRRSSPSR